MRSKEGLGLMKKVANSLPGSAGWLAEPAFPVADRYRVNSERLGDICLRQMQFQAASSELVAQAVGLSQSLLARLSVRRIRSPANGNVDGPQRQNAPNAFEICFLHEGTIRPIWLVRCDLAVPSVDHARDEKEATNEVSLPLCFFWPISLLP